jgi:hypothetical protein
MTWQTRQAESPASTSGEAFRSCWRCGPIDNVLAPGLPALHTCNGALSVHSSRAVVTVSSFPRLCHTRITCVGRCTTPNARTSGPACCCRTSTFDVENKLDASPVTIADRKAEEAMRALITAAQPHHSVFGEEFGLQLGQGTAAGDTPEYLWVLDPIDGTKSFITGRQLPCKGRRMVLGQQHAKKSRGGEDREALNALCTAGSGRSMLHSSCKAVACSSCRDSGFYLASCLQASPCLAHWCPCCTVAPQSSASLTSPSHVSAG